MKACLLCTLLWITIAARSQHVIQGMVADEQGKAVAGASVFLNTTSIGTVSAADGSFRLTVPQGRFELIVSFVGYQTHSQVLTDAVVKDTILVRLKIKSEEMENLTIIPFIKDGWKLYGRFFMENFIGTSKMARECKLLNAEVIRFRFNKKTMELSAVALQPLLIENKALGYRIQYQMERFTYANNLLVVAGFPYFEEMQGTESQQMKWEQARKDVFYGSVMHFMRAVYRNRIEQEGFLVNAVCRKENLEKKRISKKIKDNYALMGSEAFVSAGPDSSRYYREQLAQPNFIDSVSTTALTGDSIAYAVDSTTIAIEFENQLRVIYLRKKASRDYRILTNTGHDHMVSLVSLNNNKSIEVQSNGMYYDPLDFVLNGYWSWSEKISTMLPFNYNPK